MCMYCTNCGKKLEEENNFCINCGKAVKSEKTNTVQNDSNNHQQEESSGKAVASIVLGIISITIPFLPLAIVGLLLAIAEPVKDNKKSAGMILNTISTILSVIATIFIISLFSLFLSFTHDYYDDDEDYEDYEDYTDDYYFDEDEEWVGNDTYGYVIIPGDWHKLETKDNTSLCYGSIKNYSVTLKIYDENITLEQATTRLEEEVGETYLGKDIETTISEYDGAIIKTKDKDGIYIYYYLIDTEDDLIRLIEMRGPSTTSKYFEIPDTYEES